MATQRAREFDFDLDIAEFGVSKMLRATTQEIPNLIVMGTDDSDLWNCLTPVITNLFGSQGDDVRTLTLAKGAGPRNIRVHIEVSDGL
jgi:hypothetical protein